MQYVNLGRTGLKVSRLCLGTMTFGSRAWRPWTIDEDEARPLVCRALEAGVTFFDTADMYSDGLCEQILGRALKDYARREDVVIATKLFWSPSGKPNTGGLSRKHVMDAIDASLTRLGVEYVDLWQIHAFDRDVPIEETLEAMSEVVKAGKALHLGASNIAAWQLSKALFLADGRGWSRFASVQPQYNLVYREEERELLPLALDQGVGVIPYSPLARGFLAGNRGDKPFEGETQRAKTDQLAARHYYRSSDHVVVEALGRAASLRGLTNTQFALAWVLHNPAVTAPIVGVSRQSHLDDALAAIEVTLSREEVLALEAPYQTREVLRL